MARLEEGTSPRGTRLDEVLFEDLGELRAARRAEDRRIVGFVEGLSEERLAGPLAYATSSGAPHTQPLHEVLAHLFNHQTHHRGQAHAVLTGLGRKAPPMDLVLYLREAATAA